MSIALSRLLLLVAAFVLACSASAQTASPRVVWLSPSAESEGAPFFTALRNGLRELGYTEGKNITLEARWGDGTTDSMRRNIGEVLQSKPAVLVAQGSIGPLVPRANLVTPVVFGYSGDPAEAGMVESLARPGGNMTGMSYMNQELVGKRMEMLKEALPGVKRLAVVASPTHPGDASERRATLQAATKLGVTLDYFEVRPGVVMEDLLATVAKSRADAALFFPTQTIIANRRAIAAWAEKNRMPAISGWSQFADGGNLMSYGPNLADASRRLAFYVDRILKGSKPGDLPVELPSRVEFVVNLKAARLLGLSLPQSLLLRADRVIE